VVNEKNQRLIFFGKYAGLAGMIEVLHAYGQKLKLQGYDTPLEKIKQPYEYGSVANAKKEIEAIGYEIDEVGLPVELAPIVFGFAGYGNVSRGAQEIFDLLPHKVISANILDEMYENFSLDNLSFYKVVFSEDDIVRPKQGEFVLQDYYDHPENYTPVFERYLSRLEVLINGIYWSEAYPRLVTKQYLKNETVLRSNLKLKVIGDISCDIDGGIEITHKITKPDVPTYTYFANEDRFEDGTQRLGVTVMAVDNLPCEFSRASSKAFSKVLKEYVDNMVSTDFNTDFANLTLSPPMRKALVLHHGEFTPDYLYMKRYL